MTPALSAFLNLARWLAALLVLASHARNLILVDMKEVQAPTLWVKALYASTGLGHAAVIVFFVISGFLVGGVTLERWRRDVDWRSYAIARVSRIYTVLIPALAVGALLDIVGSRWFDAAALYRHAAQLGIASIPDDLAHRVDLLTALGNLLMLQGIAVPALGSNGPLWSLSFECWYYVMFAVVTAALLQGRPVWLVLVAFACLLLPGRLVLWGAIWSLGILAHRWAHADVWRPSPLLGVVAITGALWLAKAVGPIPDQVLQEWLIDAAVGLAFAFALAARWRRPIVGARFHAWAADFSYTTYVCHFPALVFGVAAVHQGWLVPLRVQPDANGVALLAATVLALLLYCLAFSRLTERHTPRVRRLLERLVSRRPASPVSQGGRATCEPAHPPTLRTHPPNESGPSLPR